MLLWLLLLYCCCCYCCACDRQSYNVTVELDVTGTAIKSRSSYDLKNPNFRYMSTAPAVPGTMHTNPTDAYYHEVNAAQSMEPSNNHSATNSASSQYSSPQMAVSNIMSPSNSQSVNSLSLNPAAPQFVPLPEHRLPSNSDGVVSPSAGGFYQSNALYMMGSQQMVYSQCPPGIGNSNVIIPSVASTSDIEKENFRGTLQNQVVSPQNSRVTYGAVSRQHYY